MNVITSYSIHYTKLYDGTLLALGGMYNLLIPFLVLLGTFIPPIGGVIMADSPLSAGRWWSG